MNQGDDTLLMEIVGWKYPLHRYRLLPKNSMKNLKLFLTPLTSGTKQRM